MDRADIIALKAELIESRCELAHEPNTVPPQAVEYLAIPLGYKESEDVEQITGHLSIPICQECADELTQDEWILCICSLCLSSCWMDRERSRRAYAKDCHIIWYDTGCPRCK